MTPEEFFYLDRFHEDENVIYEMRIRSLSWVLASFRNGKIRKKTILDLIPLGGLDDVMKYLLIQERYEECAIVRDIIQEIYNTNNLPRTESPTK
tara:strand:+ start:105 stop:386 length:282 start_codon:yes stop_codon:yes gene_type:complete